ncbi:hypothetical protein Tco_0764836 [Tanacetum coccineum]
MLIPAWMITEEMKLTEHYKIYAEVFGIDVPLTQSQPTESTQGTYRTPSAPRLPNPATETVESSVLKRSTVIHFRLSSRQSARLTPPVPVPSTEKANEMILQDTIQVILAEHKTEEIEKLIEDPENVDDSSPPRHDDTSIPGTRLEPRNDKESPKVEIVQEKEEDTTKDTEVEPNKDTPMVDVTNIVTPVNVEDDKEDEITDELFELRRRVKGKNVEETRILPISSPTRSPRNLSTLVSSDTEKLQELTVTHPTPSSGSSEPKFTKTNRLLSLIKAKPNRFKRYKSFFHELQGRYGYLFAHLKKRFMSRKSSDQLADNLHDVMIETLPFLVKEKVMEQVKKKVPAQAHISSHIQNAIDNAIPSLVDASVRSYMSGHILHVHPAQVQSSSVPEQQHQLYLAMKADPLLQQQDIAIWLALQMKFEKTQVPQTACRYSAVRTRDQDDPHDDAHPEGENSAKRQKTSEYEAYVSGESSSGQVNVEEPGPSTSEIVARRANDFIMSITEPDYKNLNKNDIEDMYLLIVNNKVPDYANTGLLWSLSMFIRSSVIWERVHNFQLGIESYQQKINLTAPTITLTGIKEYDVFSIVYEPVHGIIYTNSKKEKRVMRHSEIHKFCDATLRRTLEGLKRYYNNVKYGYVQKELTNDEVEYLKLFEEEIEVRLNYRDQMRRWEMYVNGRPLGPRRERPE